MRKTYDIMGIPVDAVTMQDAIERLTSFISEDRLHTVYTPNAEIMMDASNDEALATVLKEADMVIPDGAGVVLASKILGNPLPEKVPGFDLAKNSFSMEYTRPVKYFFFGSKPGVAEKAAESVMASYPNSIVVGTRNGYFKEEEIDDIIKKINESEADILLVALGAPRQENWIYANRNKLKVKVAIGVGGTLDVLAGTVLLAPEFFRKNGLEWLYRLYREPWRFKRMLKLPKYVLKTIAYRLSPKH